MRAAIAFVLAALPLPVFAQGIAVPAEREMYTDRPDKTESAYSVPKGRIQIEMDFANYTRDRNADSRIETVGVTPFNLKFGVARNTDIQFVVSPYIHQTTTSLQSGKHATVDGFGDVTLRLKQNLWGNDGGRTSFALMPYVTLPTSKKGLGTDIIEFGMIAPLAIKLTDAIDVGVMTELDGVENDNGRGRRVSSLNTATLGFALTKRLGMYTEIYGEHGERGNRWVVTGDAGFTYIVAKSVQLDVGVNLGLNRAADDVNVFTGLSCRF